MLALLGTNGAGKSTALRIAAGLETPVPWCRPPRTAKPSPTPPRSNGSRLGVHLLPGGKGVFPEMTIAENLEMGAFAYRSDRADMQRRIERVFDLFPMLAARKDHAG